MTCAVSTTQGEEITLQRNSLWTKDVIGRIRCFLNVLTSKRCIRASERKNSLFFGSNRMANVPAAYHTLISTCRANGISALAYLKKFFHEVVKGRRDYENLLLMIIEINTNKL